MVKNVRESAVKEILDTIDDITNMFKRGTNPKSKTALKVSSISKASKDLIMTFPVLCDDSIDPKTAAMICKAVERKAVAMLQMLFASCAFNAESGRDIIAQWHSNIDTSDLTLDDYLDLCDKFVGEAAALPVKEQKLINEAVAQMKIEMQNGYYTYPASSISESSINDYKVTNKNGKVLVTEAPSQYADLKTVTDIEANKTELINKQLLPTDVKKCNELVPSLMIIRFNSGDPDSGPITTNEFIAGVKARLIAVDSYDIIDRIVTKNKDKAGLVNLVRATTNEISFVKDYLLAIDRAKLDAKNNSIKNRSSRIWKTLEKRATRSVWKRLMGKTNDAGCITTLVISAEVANLLKKEHGINIADVKTASTIMDAYNLLALVIVDESTEVARFLYDGDGSFEDLSFSSLERESNDGSYKKVINLLSKMNRG